jgi:Saxitoxin biosynthesis operon protein SxtJ
MSTPPATPVTRGELRSFGLTVGAAFVALSLVATWRARHLTAALFATVGALLVGFGMLAPIELGSVYRAWMGLALALSRVTTPIFMGVVYFVVLTPVGLLLRLFGRRPLRAPRSAESAWVDRAPEARRSDMRRQF